MTKKYQIIFLTLLAIPTLLFSQNEGTQGKWGEPIEFGLVPVAVANLPDGKLITWSSQFRNGFTVDADGMTYTELFDPFGGPDNTGAALGDFTSNTNHDMFCPGINNLADGRILSAGGTSSEKTSIYDWRTNKWTVADQMNIPRGYQGNVTLPNGAVFTVGGSWSGGSYTNRDAEIYTPLTGWLKLPNIQGEDILVTADYEIENQGAYRVDNHVWLWPAPNGKLFHAGPSEMMHWIDADVPGGLIVEAGIRQDVNAGVRDHYSMKGNTVMFDTGKILKTGGARAYGDDEIISIPAQDNSFVIDLNNVNFGDMPTVTSQGTMSHPRTMHNSTVLPNGEVLVTGGLQGAAVFTDESAVLGAEIFNENTGWRTVAGMTVPRTYHSVSILMTDGRVFVGGGGLCDSTPGCEDHRDAEIYSPPYLFNPDNTLASRPIISAGPDYADYNSTINVTATADTQEFSLIRFSAATHSTNNEQRRISVNSRQVNGTYDIEIPQRELLPPGYYMLFGLNGAGVPSIAHTIRIGNEAPLTNNPNLVLDMQFDEGSGITASDSSQYNNNGTIVQRDDDGDIETPDQYTWSSGIIGDALEFDGLEFNSNSLLDIDYSEELASTAKSITVSAWVYRNSSSGIPQANGKIANVGILSHDYPNLFFGFHNSLYKWAFLADGPLDCYAGYAPLDTWVHLAATYDGTVAKLYANGVEVSSREMTGLIGISNDGSRQSKFTASGFYDHRYDPDDPANLQASQIDGLPAYGNTSGITDEISGKMDLLRVYNKVLDPAEIQALYKEGLDTNNPGITNCEGNYLTAEYRIGLNGTWLEGNTIIAPEGSEVFIRPKNYSGEYILTTPQYDGPTYSNVNDSSRFTSDNAYQIDTFVTPAFNLDQWNNSDRNNGLVDSSNEGQFVLTTLGGCPTTIYFSLINNNPSGGCPDYLPNEDPTLFITSGAKFLGLDEAFGINDDTNNSSCALKIQNTVIDTDDTSERWAHFTASLKLSDFGLKEGDEIYLELDGKGDNNPRAQVYRNDDPPNNDPLMEIKFDTYWITGKRTFKVPANTETLDLWLFSNFNSMNPGSATFDNLKIINLTATDGNYPPNAEFTTNTVNGTSPLIVNFDASNTTDDEGIDRYNWKFGDNNNSSLKAPSYTFNEPGVYEVTLSVFDTGGLRDTKTTTITVTNPNNNNEPPKAAILASPKSGEYPLNVDFDASGSTDDSGTIIKYEWDFGDNSNTGSGDKPSHTYTREGTFNAKLTITDENNLTASTTIQITVTAPNLKPTAIVKANPTTGIAPLTVNFDARDSTDDSGIIFKNAWNYGDGTTGLGETPTKIYTKAGTYIAELEVFDEQNLSSKQTITITVNEPNQAPVADAKADVTSGNTPLTVSFDATGSTDDDTITSYQWNFGDGNSANGSTPSHTYTTAGTFNAVVTVTDNEGLFSTETVQITTSTINTNQAPVADAKADVTSGNTPLTVSFDATDSTDDDTITSYQWNFGDGNSANGSTPSHTYTTAGTFNAVVTVTDNEGLFSTETVQITTSTINTNQAPVADAKADVTSGNTPLTVSFDATGSTDDDTITSYQWNFGDGNSANGSTPSHTYTTAGTFNAVVTVTDNEGLFSTETVQITTSTINTNQAPVADAKADVTSGNTPLTVSFDATGSTDDDTITSYQWNFGDGNSANGSTPSHTYTTAGTFNAVVTVTDNEGLFSTETVQITTSTINTNQAPVADAKADVTSGNTPLTVSFDATGSTDDDTITSYQWNFGDGNSANGSTPSHIYTTVGTFNAVVTVTDNEGLFSTATVQIITSTINPNQAPVADAKADVTSGNTPLTVSFDATGSTDDDTITSYQWNFGDGNSANGSTPSHTYTTAGTFNAVVTVTDNEGLFSTATVQIITSTINPNQAPVADAKADVTSGNTPLTVSFDATDSTDDDTITSYQWNFGDGNSANGSTPSHTYTTAGTFNAVVTVTDNEGLFSTATVQITTSTINTNQAPVAEATADVTSGNTPLTVSFDATGSTDDDTITSYQWNFGDGNSANGSTPSHTYTTAGTFNAVLTVTDNEGLFSTETVQITTSTINPNQAPVADAKADVTSGNTPLTVSFDATGSTDDDTITSYQWNFGDGNSANGSTPSHTYTTAGTFNAVLTVTDNEGLFSTETVQIITSTINPNQAPVADAKADVTSGNTPLTVSFDATGSTDDDTITSYQWNFGDGNSANGSTPSHTYTTAGTFNAVVTVTDNEGLKHTDTIEIITTKPNLAPIASATADPTSGITPLVVNFDASGSTDDNNDILAYIWDFGDGTTGNGKTTAHTYTTAGTFNAILTIVDTGNLTSTSTISIHTVAPNQGPIATISASSTTGITPVLVNFDGSKSTDDSGIISSYLWDFGDGTTATSVAPEHTFTEVGTYNVTLTVTDAQGESDSDNTTITVNEIPNQPPVVIINASPIIANTPLVVDFIGSNSTDDDTIVSYLWDFGDGTSTTIVDPKHTYTVVGEYIVTLTLTDSKGVSNSESITITVQQNSEGCSFKQLQKYFIINENDKEINISELIAMEGDKLTIGINSSEELYTISGPVNKDLSSSPLTIENVTSANEGSYTLTTKDGCSFIINIQIISNETLATSIKEINVYPNPVRNETLKVQLSKFMNESIEISFYDIYGKLVLENNIKSNHGKLHEINISILNNGIYFMELVKKSDADSVMKKLSKLNKALTTQHLHLPLMIT